MCFSYEMSVIYTHRVHTCGLFCASLMSKLGFVTGLFIYVVLKSYTMHDVSTVKAFPGS
jgi:hypothetical protein